MKLITVFCTLSPCKSVQAKGNYPLDMFISILVFQKELFMDKVMMMSAKNKLCLCRQRMLVLCV